MYNQQAVIRKERNNKGEMRVIRVEIVEFRCASSQVDLVSKDQDNYDFRDDFLFLYNNKICVVTFDRYRVI